MNRIAFLIPIHLPHFKYAKGILDSFKENGFSEQADLWFVFTNNEEKEEFGEYKNSVILPEHLCNFENRGIINIKKFYGLSQIKDKYKYIIVLDAESLFIRNVDLEKICNDYFNRKILYGNKQLPEGLERTKPIKNNCKRFFVNCKNILKDDLYLWFNQPCIYKTATLDEFFKIINDKENIAKLTWYDFDYYIYMYYLILYHGFKIEDIEIESNYGICEAGLDYLYFKSNKYEKIPIYMCSQATFNKFDNPNLFIICHLDRDNIWMQRVTNIKIDNLSQKINQLNSKIKEYDEQIKSITNLFPEVNYLKKDDKRDSEIELLLNSNAIGIIGKLAIINNNLKDAQENVLNRKYQTNKSEYSYDKEHPLISIIIPVYNCENYLNRTLDSILVQSLRNIEIICINDGSQDKSLEILQQYAERDSRIIVIDKENGGQASARNKGLEVAKGDYIGFIDADDTIPEDYYQKLYESAFDSNADIVQCRVLMIYEKDRYTKEWELNNDILTLDSRNYNFNKLLMTYTSGFVWNKIYRKSLFKNIKFINGIYWEDNPFNLEIALKADKILSIPDTYYYYLQRENSTVHSKNAKIHFDLLKSSEYIIDYLNNPNNQISEKDYKEFLHSLICRLNLEYVKAFSNPNLSEKERKKYRIQHHRLLFKIKYLPLSEKLNYTFEKAHLTKHINNFLKPFKIFEYLLRLIKYIIGTPYYLIKDGWK